MFVLARIIGGISKGNVSLSATIVTDITTPANRGKGMAFIGVAFSLGFLFGPMIGAMFSVWSKGQDGDWFQYPAMTALFLSTFDVLFLTACLKETLPWNKRNLDTRAILHQVWMYLNPMALFNFSSLTNLDESNKKSIRKIGLAYYIYLFLYSGMEFTLTFLTHLRFNFSSIQQGRMFLFIGIIMTILQGGVVRRLRPGTHKKWTMIGLLVVIPSFAVIGNAKSILSLYVGLFLYAFSTAFVVPCMTTIISEYGEVNQKGIILGVFRSLGALGRAFGPLFGSVLYWCLGPEISYSLGGILLLLPLYILKTVH